VCNWLLLVIQYHQAHTQFNAGGINQMDRNFHAEQRRQEGFNKRREPPSYARPDFGGRGGRGGGINYFNNYAEHEDRGSDSEAEEQ